MSTEVRYESGPFPSSSSDDQWMLLSVYVDGRAGRQFVVRTAPRAAHAVFGGLDPFWWYVARAGADRVHRDHLAGIPTPGTFEVTAPEMRAALHETPQPPEPLVSEATVLRTWA